MPRIKSAAASVNLRWRIYSVNVIPVNSENDRCCDFEQPISGGRLFGFYYPEPHVVYVDLFLNRFFDPRHAAEFAMSALGGGYYRLQPHVRQ